MHRRELLDDFGLLDRRAAYDDAVRTRGEPSARVLDRAYAAAGLHACAARLGGTGPSDLRLACHAAAATKLPSIAKPTAPLFSGWNCVAHSGPRSTAAANRRP